MPPAAQKPRNSGPKDHDSTSEKAGKFIQLITRMRSHFGRFAADVTGLMLLVIALLLLVGFTGLSGESLLSSIADFLQIWLGWGILLLIASACFVGIALLRRGRNLDEIDWKRMITLEIAALLTLAVLSWIGGNSLSDLEGGWWGGRIGWGLVTFSQLIFGEVLGNIIILCLWVIFILSGFFIWERLSQWISVQANAGQELAQDSQLDEQEAESQIAKAAGTSKRMAAQKLPPEFRKSLKASTQQDTRSAAVIERDERLPPLNLLSDEKNVRPDERTINQTAGLIEKTLADFGIPARVVGFRTGPTVTQFAVEPGFFEKNGEHRNDLSRIKVRVAQIANLQRDLALALSADRLRIEAPVPGRSFVGIEVPNANASLVRLRPILETDSFYKLNSPLAIALGRDVSGHALVADLARMPHLLIAGTTGSGKSVCIAAIATCLAMNNTPEELRLVMIDSKMVELIRFNGLAHLYGKVETDVQRILGVLRWIVVEMDHRYKLLEAANARDIETYNRKLRRRKDAVLLPRIVVLMDEMADLMMSAPDQTEHSLVRLAQMARATGIHLVVATQRPSTDVVTGLIKANFPARISFTVASQVDSRVILDAPGGETLLGRGDMLFLNHEVGVPVRAQGVMVSDQEIERLIGFWQHSASTAAAPPWEDILNQPEEDGDDVLVEKAISLIKKEGQVSASLFQRRLHIGYPRAARLVDILEDMGVIGASAGAGRSREILIDLDEIDE